MYLDIVIKNYRCFSIENPARIRVSDGFTSFVGINNSGKSALLKFFYEFRNIFSQLGTKVASNPISGGIHTFNYPSTVKDKDEVFNNRNKHDISIEISFISKNVLKPDANNKFLLVITVFRETKDNYKIEVFETSREPKVEVHSPQLSAEGAFLSSSNFQSNIEDALNMIRDIGKATYIGPFRNAMQVGASQIYYDIKIGKDFIELWNEKKTGDVKEDSREIHRLEQDISRIFGFKEFSVNATSKKDSLQLLIDGESYNFTEVGAGLSQLIIVMANTLTSKSPFVIIDEPETSLHPSLQIDFLTTLGSYAKRGVLFATHNIGLARAVSGQIYSLIKLDNGKSVVREFENTPSLAEFLGELSFSGYRELGFNQILLVEGRTEIKTFIQFLRFYNLDHKVVVLPLGGNDLITSNSEQELLELTRISQNISAIIDSEKTSSDSGLEKSRKEFEKNCKKIGIDCHILERRATENYLSEQAIKIVLGEKYQALKPYEKLETAELGWSKNDNWKIARQMTIDDIKNTDLGRFLDGLAKKIGQPKITEFKQ